MFSQYILLKGLTEIGVNPVVPEAGFFIMGDTSKIDFDNTLPLQYKDTDITFDSATKDLRDYNFCRWLSFNAAVTPIPPSAFYSESNKELGSNFARFAFCKEDDLLMNAVENMKKCFQISH